MEKVALIIKLIRQGKNLKQEYVASKLRITCASYANIENNRVQISLKRLEDLACVLEIELYKIIKMARDYSNPPK